MAVCLCGVMSFPEPSEDDFCGDFFGVEDDVDDFDFTGIFVYIDDVLVGGFRVSSAHES